MFFEILDESVWLFGLYIIMNIYTVITVQLIVGKGHIL